MKNWTIRAKLMLGFFISIIMTILNIVFSELTTRMAARYSGEALKDYNRNASIFTYSVGIISIIIILWVAFVIIRQIRMSVEELSNAARQIAKGRVDIQIKKYSNDELGQLVDEYEKVIQNIKNQAHVAEEVSNGNLTITVTPTSSDDLLGNSLKKLVEDNYHALSNISESGTQVTISSSQVASASQALAQGSTQQASAIQQITASIDEIAEKTKENAEQANSAANLIEQAIEDVKLSLIHISEPTRH